VPAATPDDLREARALVLDSEDRVIVARSELEQLQAPATSATAAANRANERRQRAINEVVRPECARLLQAAERLTKELGEARLALRFVGNNLVDGSGDERRQIRRMLDLDLGSMFLEEFGFTAEPSAALGRGGLSPKPFRMMLQRPSRPDSFTESGVSQPVVKRGRPSRARRSPPGFLIPKPGGAFFGFRRVWLPRRDAQRSVAKNDR
jgi:hypothetical protein